ncbi:MAG: hypothetical protein PUQ00_22160 [Nostoc sp. S13]|nr:hypothetical protein [Nostoc sp. S13]
MCNFLSNLTPNPLRQVLQVGGAAQGTGSPTSVGEQESKPLSLWGRGMEAGL